jgi:hypothetical protein
MRYHFTLKKTTKDVIKKNYTLIIVWRKQKLLCCWNCGKQYGVSSIKLKIEWPYNPSTNYCLYHIDMKLIYQRDNYTPMFVAAILTIAKICNQLCFYQWINAQRKYGISGSIIRKYGIYIYIYIYN